MLKKPSKIRLHGFNNLTKTLSFNIYDICYTQSSEDRKRYIEYIDEQYNSERLTEILKNVTNVIGAHVLNISKQDYEPQGASVTVLISEEEVPVYCVDSSCNRGILVPTPNHIIEHLDKSHVSVHTYPESHPTFGINTFRVDLDVSTCGTISPLNALNDLIKSFDSDIITVDYRVRGFTRDIDGKKHFIDHNISSIQDYIDDDILQMYNLVDTNMYQQNIFHTKMMVKNFELNNYLFDMCEEDLSKDEIMDLKSLVYNEMLEIYYGTNFDLKY